MHLPLLANDSDVLTLDTLVERHDWTVLLFYSDTCPTVRAHDTRVNALARRYAERGVGFYWIDSEHDASPERDRESSQRRRYIFPILKDSHARIADALGARYASHAFLLNANGEVVYSGGIDSDRRFLHPEATPYLANALNRVLAGRKPSLGDERALGCALAR